ncbi:MAG: hypothetical protein KDB24_11150 [Microthrixaceae bacterium]|nr:hypothetical protein [Microthrixaceae bacterium]
MTRVLLGTVAIEPNRWGTIRSDQSPTTRVHEHLAAIAAAGFDGIELWEGHLTPDLADQARAAGVPLEIFNSYVGFDDGDDGARLSVAANVAATGARAVKINVGNDPAAELAYAERLGRFVEALPDGSAALCECHRGISIAEDPVVAARILTAAGPRAHALVHTHDDDAQLRACFDAYGDRISHVHVNLLDFATLTHPRLEQVVDRLGSTVETIRSQGFDGSWTIEFVAGLLTDLDEPVGLVDQASRDLVVLRSILDKDPT